MGNVRFIILKEIRHILRDPRSLFIAILMPIMMTFLYGYAINLDIKNIRLAVLDYDQTSASRELVGRFYHSGYFAASLAPADMADPEAVLKRGDAHAVMIIRGGFAEALRGAAPYQLGLLLDGADANMSAAAASYSNVIIQRYLGESPGVGAAGRGVALSQRVLYNPDLKSSHFLVPGLIAIILMMISALLTSVTIAREKETGTMEQLLTAPVGPFQVILGKVIPYVGLALLDGVLVLSVGVLHFGVPLIGSSLLLLFFGLIYIIAALSLGVLISTLARTQQVAMMAALVATVLPSVMLSGFIFEIRNMPALLRFITMLVPARYFLLIMRGVMLKGSGLAVLWPQAAALVALTTLLLVAAVKRFRIRIG
ncbi:MAG: ABC transporter permease [Candidatus Krumholzibacteria bacterium]|nr:ABC transporter permease [Candidatus Krumholzibacteria bacterium]